MNVKEWLGKASVMVKQKELFLTAVGLFFLSLSLLVYEIALTRLLSVVLVNQYVFLVVSGAVLGLSFGAAFDYLRARRSAQAHHGMERGLAWWSACGAMSICLAVFFIVWAGRTDSLLLLALASIAPFFFAGVTLAALFRTFAAKSSLLYAADLVGAAFGAVVVVWLLDIWGGPNTLFIAALGTALAAAVFLSGEQKRQRGCYAAVGAVILTSLLFGMSLIYPAVSEVPIGRDSGKDMFRLLNDPSIQGEVVESRWGAFGRTDLVRFVGEQDSMTLFIDGAAGTPMYRWNGVLDLDDGALGTRMTGFPAFIPFLIMNESQKESAFIIGPGGGRDVLVALLAGIERIVAAEVNPEFVEIVRDYANYNGGLYTRLDNVEVVVAEGRNFLERSTESYDTIMLTLPITKGSRSYEGYTLTESFLFTKESIQAYLAHLDADGAVVVVTHSLTESMRLIMTTLDALREQGLSVPDAMQRIYLLGHPTMPVFVLKKSVLTRDEADTLHAVLHLAGLDGESSYIPHVKQVAGNIVSSEGQELEWRMLNQNLIDLAEGRIQLEQLIDAMPVDISPVSDDRPFFYKSEPGIPGAITVLFWGALLLTMVIMVAPMVSQRIKNTQGEVYIKLPWWRFSLIFVGLGIGFMLVEVALFQKLVLYVGHPTFALSLLLFSLLLGAGMGSLISSRLPDQRLSTGVWVSAATAAASVMVVAMLIESTFKGTLSTALEMPVVPALLLITLGLSLGIPFPLSMRLMKQMKRQSDIPWAWSVNGAASVIGSVLAIMLAMKFGYTIALLCGALIYFGVAIMVFFTRGHFFPPEERGACLGKQGGI